MILITLLFLVVLLGYARSQTRSWFNVNSYIRIILIMLISSITIYILGVTAIPHVSPTHPIDDDVYWDRN
jgi:biotin transporter BioY